MNTLLIYQQEIERYIELFVRNEIHPYIDLTYEYTFCSNVISQKMIIVPTFSEKIYSDKKLEYRLISLFHFLNKSNLSINSILDAISFYEVK